MSRRRTAGDASIAIAYLRVSTDEQQLGPEAQRAAIEAWAARAGITIAAWCSDLGIGGAAPLDRRPGLLAAIEAVTTHRAGVLVASRRDRFARDVMVAAQLERLAERAGARALTADGVAAGEGPEAALMRTMLDGFAQYERALIKLRTRAALAAKRARGERAGALPFGHRLDPADAGRQRLAADPAEQAALETISELARAGWSVRKIAAELERRGVPARGRRWWPSTVALLAARVRPTEH